MDIEARNRIEQFLIKTDYRIIDFVIKGDSRSKIYEIFVDSRKELLVDDLAKMNREIWDLLETKNLVNNISKITVSSPGVDNPFKYIWQLFKHTGRTFDVKLRNDMFFTGILEEVKEEEQNILRFNILRKSKNSEGVIDLVQFSDIKELKVKLKFK